MPYSETEYRLHRLFGETPSCDAPAYPPFGGVEDLVLPREASSKERFEKLVQLFDKFAVLRTSIIFSVGPNEPCKALIGERKISFDTVEEKFDALLRAWRQDTLALSNQVAILTHPCHYAIIGMGHQALPHIFKDLSAGGGPWFVALRAITQENPVAEENAKSARRMREDWLAWGAAHDYVGPRSANR